MAFRVGKSVMLNFGNDLEPVFIFSGLALLLLIGPLLKWYISSMTQPDFRLLKIHYVELIPFLLLFITSFFITKNWFDANNRQSVIIFGSTIIFIYLHFAFYIFISGKVLKKTYKKHTETLKTKSQKNILSWLYTVIIGFIMIWISYFLNIIENSVPYIIGPIIYSVVIYYLSFKAFKLKVTDITGSVFKIKDDIVLFNDISQLIIDEKLYLESDISLSSVSKLVGKSVQKTSEAINQYANQNFNDFINYYRIQDAKKMLIDEKTKKYTISSIAFDIGFSSLSSFNSAFKKFEGTTPSSYRKANT
ncbi:helix-turn-helix domain-containing protein [Aquimarina algicola]|uniref:AraC family transcriptional regulator n=1 Tax=Aquimarina algicola TaxID=2589995 RepID=A0A504JMK6_9FLAO|nr:helix-turn-helix domain-containing protein [Aquimarina algicola]TPN88913.1 AraC family transcriptional regulator [Aquimarina algicola]